MYSEAIARIFGAFEAEKIEAYIVGGAVRNRLLNVPIKDYDFAVACSPEESIAILENVKMRVLRTGFQHGTVTAMIDGHGYEITSFRQDITTDGRHAEVSFGGDLMQDALRRDFTINALYLDANAQIHDPLNGMQDIENRNLRFVGEAQARIREDYLRILRFYRFLAQYDLTGDEDAQIACKALAGGLNQISAERIGAEMQRLLEGAKRLEALEQAEKAGVTAHCFPNFEHDDYQVWVNYCRNAGINPDWRVEAVCGSKHIPEGEWRLSRAQSQFMKLLREANETNWPAMQLGEIYGSEIGYWALHIRAARQNLKLQSTEFADLQFGANVQFPVNGHDLQAIGLKGRALGACMQELKSLWRNADYKLDKAELLKLINSEYR